MMNNLSLAITLLNANYDFRFNSVTRNTEFRAKGEEYFKVLKEKEFNGLYLDIRLNNIELSKSTLKTLIFSNKMAKDYDPIIDYLNGLPEWDGKTDYISEFMKQVLMGEQTWRPDIVENFMKWFIKMVASFMYDDVVNDKCLVLEGPQGIGKTRFLNSLVPWHMREEYLYNTSEIATNSEALTSKMLINIEDLRDIEELKQALTVKTILFRSAFSQDYLSCKRKASICFSIGDIKGLIGRSGEKLRRLIVIPVSGIMYNLEMDIDNLYSQAVSLIKGGDRISITPKTFPVKGDFSQGIDRIIK